MPSHISHALLAEDAANEAGLFATSLADAREERARLLNSILLVGAQGPDFFLHNHRRKPRGFRYGALLHRKGNDRLLLSLARTAHEHAVEQPEQVEDLIAYSFGYISHIWLDRLVHPYINLRAGWRGVPDRHPDRPFMHAFLERLIDVQVLRTLRDCSVADYRFADRLPRSAASFFGLRPILVQAITASLMSAGSDEQLPRRIINALHDGFAFYRFTESPDDTYFYEARARERAGRISSRWLSLVHPPETLIPFDTLNTSHATWNHPCAPDQTSGHSVLDRYRMAMTATVETWSLWEAVRRSGSEREESALTDQIGPWNLNDGISADPPLHRQWVEPFPLLKLYADIKSHFER